MDKVNYVVTVNFLGRAGPIGLNLAKLFRCKIFQSQRKNHFTAVVISLEAKLDKTYLDLPVYRWLRLSGNPKSHKRVVSFILRL